ncbi:MAG: DNA polymerase III subunit chi [Chlamydiota bacterium]
MSDAKQIRITFLQVQSNAMKRDLLVAKATEYFEKSTPLLFRLPNQPALDYLDLLLWRYPADSFLPHAIHDRPCNTLITLTATKEANPNQAHTIFNLTADPVANTDHFFSQIYEFEDLSLPQNPIVKEHYLTYKKRGYTIVTA